jgi:NAD(P)-dependent dehydrogenase (short-subunit alcohol dehydrogenase family)
MKNNLPSKVALITGGTSGIGRAAALAFARENYRVAIAGRREEQGAAVVREIEALGGEALFVRTDVTREADIAALVGRVVERFGRLDVAFNNAGIEGRFGLTTAEQTDEHYREVFDANVRGVLLAMKHEIPALLKNGGGSIINTSSVLGSVAMPGTSVYTASKFAVNGLSKTAALEYAQQGIRVNIVSPGPIQTEMADRAMGAGDSDGKKHAASQVPLGRLGIAEEVASAVVWLASPGAAYVTGQDILVDGGYTTR